MADNWRTVRSLEALAKFLRVLPAIGGEAYANGGRRARAIVEKHFTPGNQGRYEWAPLSPKYSALKRGEASNIRKNLKKEGRTVPRSIFGGNLPMLNGFTGRLRAATTAKKHQVVLDGDMALCIFQGLPDYAEYLHTGTAKMPQRSPVKPSAADLAEVRDEMSKAFDAAVRGATAGLPVTVGIPGAARLA